MAKTISRKQFSGSAGGEVDRLVTASVLELRKQYRELFKRDPFPGLGPDLLRRTVAQAIQTKKHGGLSATTQQLLDRLIKATRGKPAVQIEIPRKIKPGAILVRDWDGTNYRVTVLVDGFSYQGKSYSSHDKPNLRDRQK